MSTRAEWEAAADDFMAAERERLGGPPTPEEVVAYARGELSESDAARVRSLLVYYPELTSVLTEPAPAEVVDFTPRRRILPLFTAAAGALLVIGLGIQVQRLSHELSSPHVLSTHSLKPKQLKRSAAPQPPNYLLAAEKNSVLMLDDLPPSPRYRIDLMNGTKRLWSVAMQGQEDEPVQLSLPRGLEAGSYRIDVYDADSKMLATYDLRVTEP